MLMIRDDFTRFNAVYFMRSKDEFSRYFRQYLVDYRTMPRKNCTH